MSPELSLPPGARAVLSAPDMVARALAAGEHDPQRRWLLRRPRRVRRSFVEHVVDGGGSQERWMLLADDDTRESYVEEVLLGAATPDRQAIWLLRQEHPVRMSYVSEVLD